MPRLGELRATDVRAVLGCLKPTDMPRAIAVVVLSATGGLPFVGDVELGALTSGRGRHLALRCPTCAADVRVLGLGDDGALSCARCRRRLTPHQRNKSTAAWRRHDAGKVEQVLRIVATTSLLTDTRLARAASLAADVTYADEVRAVEAAQTVEKLLHDICIVGDCRDPVRRNRAPRS